MTSLPLSLKGQLVEKYHVGLISESMNEILLCDQSNATS